jgi:hypothetical protein
MSLAETLAARANDIGFQLHLAREPSQRQVALQRAIQAGCAGLNTVLLDPLFFQTYEGSKAARRSLGRKAIRSKDPVDVPIIGEEQFAAFVAAEKKLLRTVGFDVQHAELIGEKLLNILRTPRNDQGTESLEELQSLRDILCRLDPAPDTHTPDKEVDHSSDWLSGLVHVGLSLGGATLVVVNVTALAASHGLSAGFSELSKTAGGALFIDSAKEAWKKLKDAPRTSCKCKC